MDFAHHARQHRPQQRADEGREPAAKGGHRVAGGAIDPEQNELVARQQRENRQALRENGEHANAQSKMRGPGTHERERERVLSEHDAMDHIERQPGKESQ